MIKLNDLELAALRSLLINDIDLNRRRVVNASRSRHSNDYVIRAEIDEMLSSLNPLILDNETALNTIILTLTHKSYGSPAAGFGASLDYVLDSSTNVERTAAVLEALWAVSTNGAERSDFIIKLMLAGAAATEVFRLRGAGDSELLGDYKWKSGTTFLASLRHNNSAARDYDFPDVSGNIPSLPTSATTQTGTDEIVRKTSPTIVTPTVASLTNMQHNHQNAAGGGSLDAAAIGSGVLAIARGGVDQSAWTAWTPTYSSDIGNAAATFSGGTVTTVSARYKVLGKVAFIRIYFTGTLNAVTPAYIDATLPITPFDDNTYTPGLVINNSAEESSKVGILGTGTKLRFFRTNGALFTSSAVIYGLLTTSFELQ